MATSAADNVALGVSNYGPRPLSFPAILRNPGLSNRLAHLRADDDLSEYHASLPVRSARNRARRREENGGKRWIRRSENGSCISSTATGSVPSVLQPVFTAILMSFKQVRPTYHPPCLRLGRHFQSLSPPFCRARRKPLTPLYPARICRALMQGASLSA